MTALAPHLTAFLREHLPRERAVSPHTVKTYANCFVLLVRFASDRLKRRPTDLEIEDFGTDMIMACLLYTSPSPRDATLSRMPSSA